MQLARQLVRISRQIRQGPSSAPWSFAGWRTASAPSLEQLRPVEQDIIRTQRQIEECESRARSPAPKRGADQGAPQKSSRPSRAASSRSSTSAAPVQAISGARSISSTGAMPRPMWPKKP
jgi:hypothetical protein